MAFFKTFLFSCICLFFQGNLLAQQDSILLSKNFQFEDGIYFHLEQLQSNQPQLLWTAVKANLFTNPQTFLTKIDYIIHESDTLQLDSIWGIVLGGIPYIRITESDSYKKNNLTTFAGLQVRGKISYFTFEQIQQESIPISAFNPVTGRAFRTAIITQEVLVKKERVLDFETGKIAEFSKANLLDWVAQDKALSKSILSLSDDEVAEKLFKCILIFDDRNPIYLK